MRNEQKMLPEQVSLKPADGSQFLALQAAVYMQGGKFGFVLLQNDKPVVESPPVFPTQKEAQEASSKVLSLAAEMIKKDCGVERMIRVQREVPDLKAGKP